VGWEGLFADIAGEFDAAEAAQLAAEVDDRTRRETALVHLVDRLRAAVGKPVTVSAPQVGALSGALVDVGADWLLLREPGSRQALIPFAAVVAITGIGTRAAPQSSDSHVSSRLRFGYALRALSRDRTTVVLSLVDGTARTGTIDRVSADHLTFAVHAPEEPRRASAVRDLVVVPFTALAAVRSA
jgi:hypothetical protein